MLATTSKKIYDLWRIIRQLPQSATALCSRLIFPSPSFLLAILGGGFSHHSGLGKWHTISFARVPHFNKLLTLRFVCEQYAFVYRLTLSESRITIAYVCSLSPIARFKRGRRPKPLCRTTMPTIFSRTSSGRHICLSQQALTSSRRVDRFIFVNPAPFLRTAK